MYIYCETSLVSDHVDGSLGIFPYHGVNRDRPPPRKGGRAEELAWHTAGENRSKGLTLTLVAEPTPGSRRSNLFGVGIRSPN